MSSGYFSFVFYNLCVLMQFRVLVMVMVMVMVMHLYSAFSMWIYSNALYNTLWETLPDCFMAQFTIFLMYQVVFTGAPKTE